MDFLGKLNLPFLKKALKTKKTIDDVDQFCTNNSDFCRKNRESVCEQILILSGYAVLPPKGKICSIYKELAETAKTISSSNLSKTSYVQATPVLYKKSLLYGSNDLYHFFKDNGYPVEKDYALLNKELNEMTLAKQMQRLKVGKLDVDKLDIDNKMGINRMDINRMDTRKKQKEYEDDLEINNSPTIKMNSTIKRSPAIKRKSTKKNQ